MSVDESAAVDPAPQNGLKALDPAHAADVARLSSDAQEAEFARHHSLPTRWLGWLLISGFVLQMAGSITRSDLDLGGIVFLITGVGVLRGSQSALRFVTFVTVPAMVIGICVVIWASAHGRPIEGGKAWYQYDQMQFWTMGIAPLVYFAAEATLGIVALRKRGLVFWTKTVRIGAFICGCILLVQAGTGLANWRRDAMVRSKMPAELGAARFYLSTHGRTISAVRGAGGKVSDSRGALAELPQIESLRWRYGPSQYSNIYDRSRFAQRNKQPEGRSVKYSEWFRDASGELGMLELELVVPDNP